MPQVTILSRAKENDRGCLVATSTFFPLALATHKLAIGFKGLSAVGGSEEQQLHKNNHCEHRGHLRNSIKWLNPPTFQKSSNSSSLPFILTSKILTLVSEAPPEFPASSLLKRRRLLLDCTWLLVHRPMAFLLPRWAQHCLPPQRPPCHAYWKNLNLDVHYTPIC